MVLDIYELKFLLTYPFSFDHYTLFILQQITTP